MLRTWRRSAKLFSDFNTQQFASVMGLVLFVILLVFMTDTAPHHVGVSVDLPKVRRPVSIPGALREDAMLVAVMRDGRVFFGNEQILPDFLAEKIRDRLKDRGVERRVYIKADMRARYAAVKSVLDGVHSAGIFEVAFLVNQRHVSTVLH